MTVCIDSQICVWGIKRQAVSEQANMIDKAQKFFEWLDTEKHQVIIPTIVISEILTPEPPELHAAYLNIFKKYFIVADFDDRSALKYAEILNSRLESAKKYLKDNDVRREKMKFDYAIVACALTYSASCIYSYDKDVANFANGLIDVREIPLISTQPELPF